MCKFEFALQEFDQISCFLKCNQEVKGSGVMGQTSAGATWLVRTCAVTWDDCYDEPC